MCVEKLILGPKVENFIFFKKHAIDFYSEYILLRFSKNSDFSTWV